MKVVIARKETKQIGPKYRAKYSNESMEILREREMLKKKNIQKVYRQARYENNNHIYRGK